MISSPAYLKPPLQIRFPHLHKAMFPNVTGDTVVMGAILFQKPMQSCHLSFVWTKIASSLWNLKAYLFFGMHWIIFTVCIWKDRHTFKFRIEIGFNLFDTVLCQNVSWHGNNYLIFHICEEDRTIIYVHDEPTRVHPRTTVSILSF
jgi:hypothetical protein